MVRKLKILQFPFAVPTPEDTNPGRFITRLDFNHFRTIG